MNETKNNSDLQGRALASTRRRDLGVASVSSSVGPAHFDLPGAFPNLQRPVHAGGQEGWHESVRKVDPGNAWRPPSGPRFLRRFKNKYDRFVQNWTHTIGLAMGCTFGTVFTYLVLAIH